MRQIEAHQVRKDNSNLREFSDSLWRALRKERFKPAKPDAYTNEMAAEEYTLANTPHVVFKHDMENFIASKLTPREGDIFRLFLFGGRMTQTDIAEYLGVCQAPVANTLKVILKLVKDDFYGNEYSAGEERVGRSVQRGKRAERVRDSVCPDSSSPDAVECAEVSGSGTSSV